MVCIRLSSVFLYWVEFFLAGAGATPVYILVFVVLRLPLAAAARAETRGASLAPRVAADADIAAGFSGDSL